MNRLKRGFKTEPVFYGEPTAQNPSRPSSQRERAERGVALETGRAKNSRGKEFLSPSTAASPRSSH